MTTMMMSPTHEDYFGVSKRLRGEIEKGQTFLPLDGKNRIDGINGHDTDTGEESGN